MENNGFFTPASDLTDEEKRPNTYAKTPPPAQNPPAAPYYSRGFHAPGDLAAPQQPTPPVRPSQPYQPNRPSGYSGGYRPPVMTPPQPPRKKSSGKGWLIALVCAVALITVIIGIAIQSGSFSPSTDESIKLADTRIETLLADPSFSAGTEQQQITQTTQVLEELYDQGVLASEAEYDEENSLFTFEYSNGMLGGVCLAEFNDELNSGGTTTYPTGDTIYSSYSGEGIHVLILNGFENTTYRVDYYRTLCREWAALGITTTLDFDITVADLLTLDDYDVVTFSMHGNEYMGQPVLCLDETVTSATDRAYAEHLNNDRSVARVHCTDGRNHYWVLHSFFKKNYSSTALDGTVFFSETCKFYGCDCSEASADTALSDALLSRSAELVIGYHNSVGADYSRDVMKHTLEQMFAGSTAQAALQSAIQIYGSNDRWNDPSSDKYFAYPLLQGDGSAVIMTSKPSQYPTQQELFNETYWHWSVGPTLGTNYFCRFHTDGTFDFISMGAMDLSTTNYRYHDGVLTIGTSETYDYSDGGFISQDEYYSGMMEDYIHFTLTPATKDEWEQAYQKSQELYGPTNPTTNSDYTGAYTGDGTYYYSVACDPIYDGSSLSIYVCGDYHDAAYWAEVDALPDLAKISYSAFFDVTDIVFINSIRKNADGSVTVHAQDAFNGMAIEYVFNGDTVTFVSRYGETITGEGASISYAQLMQLPIADNCGFYNDEQLAYVPMTLQEAMALVDKKCSDGCCYVTFTTQNGKVTEFVIAYIP